MAVPAESPKPAFAERINIIGKGVTDPHIRIFKDRAYLYASNDASPESDHFVMKQWQVWASENLRDWTLESTLKPEETYIGKPFEGCWATDAIEKEGRYYWCFSEVDKVNGQHQIGMVVSDHPGGPWKDVLGRPLLPDGIVDTEVYDPCLFKEDDGSVYLLFGVWDYYIVPLAGNMLSTKEPPRKIEILKARGPYGRGKTDDKVFLHKREGIYYLSWGSYYATSNDIGGPYTYRGCIIDPARMEARFRTRTWPNGPTQGRHGSFFEWNEQWFFTYCEMCISNNRYYRDFWISYVHYRADGRIEPVIVDSQAVGSYDASRGNIPAAHYFRGKSVLKQEAGPGLFEVIMSGPTSSLEYPEVHNAEGFSLMTLFLKAEGENPVLSVIAKNHSKEPILTLNLAWLSGAGYQTIDCLLDKPLGQKEEIHLQMTGEEDSAISLQWLQFSK